MTNSVAEVKQADVIFITGSNTTESHPVIGAQVRQAVKNGTKLIVADPREIDLAQDADVFLKIKPGTSIALSNAMLNVIFEEGLEDKTYIEENTEGIEELKKVVQKYTPEMAGEICGVKPEDIRAAARLYGQGVRGSILYCMGITQHHNGTESVMSLSNLALATGNLGKEGTGINPLRGQNNVQGACDMGALPNVMPGYQQVTNAEVINKFEKAWNTKLSNNVGLTIPEVMHKAAHGDVKMIYIFGENPMVSDPDTHHVEEALKNSFVVVQDLFLTETAELADVVLPAASFAEKDGTFVNTERRVQRVRKAVNSQGEAKADWMIFMELMNHLGYDKQYKNVEEIFEEIRQVTPQYAGISYDRIEDIGIQWPCPTEDHPGTKFLHTGKPARGAGLFMAVEHVESSELGNEEYPLILTTGRILYQYHTRTMTGKTEGINQMAPESYIEMHPNLAVSLGITNGETVKVKSPRGEVRTKAKVTKIVDENVVFMPFHYFEGAANVLTNGTDLDKYCKIPGLKVTGVKVVKIIAR
ncbi:molybdopterin oxidoreductase [Alkaliphilus metalliredigens QYMF]|nr:molybdopterin oxidoreductase [Alkaliphilus metalliredigens QYMF]